MAWNWDWPAVTALASGITAATVFFGALVARRRIHKQRQREFEDFYVRRYWELLDRMSMDTLRGIDPGRRLRKKEERAIRLYFRLSEDQADLREQGWVSQATWEEWRGSIRSQLSRQPFRRLWKEAVEDAEKHRDYEFRHLRNLCGQSGKSYDPLLKWHLRSPFSLTPRRSRT